MPGLLLTPRAAAESAKCPLGQPTIQQLVGRGPWDSVCPCLGLAHPCQGLWFHRGFLVQAPGPWGWVEPPVRVSPGITCSAQPRLQAGQNPGTPSSHSLTFRGGE